MTMKSILHAAIASLEQYRNDMLYPNLDAGQRARRIEAIDAALDGCNLIQSRTADLQNACLGEASS